MKEAVCQYRDRLLAEAEPEAGEHFPVSEEFYRKIEALSGVSVAMEQRRKRYGKKGAVWRSIAKAAVAAAIIVLLILGAGVFGSGGVSKPVNASFGEFVIEWFPDHVRVYFNPLSEEELAKIELKEPEDFVLGNLPEGFALWDELQHPGFAQYVYKDEQGSTLIFQVNWRISSASGKATAGIVSTDNEQTEIRMLCEDGMEMICLSDRGGEKPDTLIWTKNGCEFSLELSTDRDIDIFEIYRSITVKNEEK